MPIIISQPCVCDLYERMEFYVSAREMSRVQAMEEYIRVALSLKQETDVVVIVTMKKVRVYSDDE